VSRDTKKITLFDEKNRSKICQVTTFGTPQKKIIRYRWHSVIFITYRETYLVWNMVHPIAFLILTVPEK